MQKKAISTADSGSLPPILYRGSVKDVRGFAHSDQVLFGYSDRYSVFDWGEMPDNLNHKGEALALLTDGIYQRLEHAGIATHRLGLVDASGAALSSDQRTRFWKVQACERHLPEFRNGSWNYDWYRSDEALGFTRNLLIPLEVVFRFGVTEGSSFFQRATPEYLHELGLVQAPRSGELLSRPVVEYFTKLEASDRFLSVADAKHIAGLTPAEEVELREQTLLIANKLREWFGVLGLQLWDGKFEFAFRPGRKLCLVDAIGPDELRLTAASGLHVSKELLRDFYRTSTWYQTLEKAKQLAKSRGQEDWKHICQEELQAEPAYLPPAIRTYVENLYLALTNAFLQKDIFAAVPSLEKLLEARP